LETECIHLLDLTTCTTCKGGNTKLRGRYRFHDESNGLILLESGRVFYPGHRVWYPYENDPIPTDVGTVHISGGWSTTHISALITDNKNLCWLEFAPSQRNLLEDDGWINLFYVQPGGPIGLRLRRWRSR
jgi:hypothetical protein